MAATRPCQQGHQAGRVGSNSVARRRGHEAYQGRGKLTILPCYGQAFYSLVDSIPTRIANLNDLQLNSGCPRLGVYSSH